MWLDTSSQAGDESTFTLKGKVIGIHVRKRLLENSKNEGRERTNSRLNVRRWFWVTLFDLQLPKQGDVSRRKENEWLKDLIELGLTVYCKMICFTRNYTDPSRYQYAAKPWSEICLRMRWCLFSVADRVVYIRKIDCSCCMSNHRLKVAIEDSPGVVWTLVDLSSAANIFHHCITRFTEQHSHLWWRDVRQKIASIWARACSINEVWWKRGWDAKYLWQVTIPHRWHVR